MDAGLASEGNTVTRVSVRAFLAALGRAAPVDEAGTARLRQQGLVNTIGRNLSDMAAESARVSRLASEGGSDEDRAYLAVLGTMMERTQAAYVAATEGLRDIDRVPAR